MAFWVAPQPVATWLANVVAHHIWEHHGAVIRSRGFPDVINYVGHILKK